MLLTRRGTASVLVSGALAVSLIAAGTDAATAAAGTASSSLNAVSLTLTGVPGAPAISLLDVGTLATTDPNAAGNLLGTSFASANITPATVDGTAYGAQSARSDQAGEAVTGSVDISALGLPVTTVVAPVTVSAQATESTARAAIGAATAQLGALTDLLGLQVSSAGVESAVTGEQASQVQGISVSGLDVALGDILPEELLAALPIDVLLDLLATLPVGAPDLQAVLDAIQSLVDDVQAGVDGVLGTAAGVENGIAAVAAAIQDLTEQQDLVDLLQVDADAAAAAVTTAADDLAAAVAAAADVENTVAGLACVTDNLLDPAAAAACLAALQATADAAVDAATTALADATAIADQLAADLADAAALLGPLAAVVDTLTTIVNDLVSQLVSLVDRLLADVNDLLAALTDLSGSLGDIIAGLLDTTLLGLGNLDLTMSAIATGDAATSSAGVTCVLGDLVVAGVNLGGGSCTGDSLSGSLLGAVSALESALGALPLAAGLVPTVNVDLMQLTSSVTESETGAVTSSASVIPLVIELPSLEIDPANLVDGLIASLSTELLDDLLAQLPVPAELQGVGLAAAAAEIEGLLGQQVPDLQDVQALIGDVVALLPDGLGIPAMTTPGFNLSIDPTSTATFAPAATAAPAPTPGGEPLPATGGGAIALAVMGLGGAYSLRRRR